MLQFFESWQKHSKGLGFLSKNTSVGLRVTLQATKDLVRHVDDLQWVLSRSMRDRRATPKMHKGGSKQPRERFGFWHVMG